MTPRQLDPDVFNNEGSSIGIILYTEQFYVHKSDGDSQVVPDSKKGGCSISWGKYPDLGRAFLGVKQFWDGFARLHFDSCALLVDIVGIAYLIIL